MNSRDLAVLDRNDVDDSKQIVLLVGVRVVSFDALSSGAQAFTFASWVFASRVEHEEVWFLPYPSHS